MAASIGGLANKGAALLGAPEIAAIAAAGQAIAGLVDGLVSLTEKSNPGLFKQYNLAVDNLTAAFGKLVEPLVQMVIPLLDIFNEAITSLQDPLKDLYDSFISLLEPLQEWWRALTNFILIPVKQLINVFKILWSAIEPVYKAVLQLGTALVDSLGDIISVFNEILLMPIKAAMEFIKPYLEKFSKYIRIAAASISYFIQQLLALFGVKPTAKKAGQKTLAAGNVGFAGIEDIGKQFREEALKNMGGTAAKTGMDVLPDISADIHAMKLKIDEFFKAFEEVAKKVPVAKDTAKAAVEAAGAATLINPSAAIQAGQWIWRQLGG